MTNKKITTLLLVLILMFAFGTRVYRLAIPKSYYFDEVYHAVTAKAYARNDPAGYEWWHPAPEPNTAYEWLHPPLGKVFMAIGWKFMGENAFAWRFPGAVFGVLVILLTYLLAVRLFKQATLGLLAAFVASLDGLLLTQSRIGMNDIYVTAFILFTLWSYWKFVELSRKGLSRPARLWLLFTGIGIGLAVSTKWSGVFLVGILGLFELLRIREGVILFLKRVPLLFLAFIVLPAGMYVLSYGQFWLQGHSFAQFEELHDQIWYYQTHLKATHPYQSKPWQWALNLRPVYYYLGNDGNLVSNIYDLMNPAVAWIGLLAIAVLVFTLGLQKKWWVSPSLFLLIAYFGVWAPWFLSPRIMFFYHYTPAVPLLSIALGWLIYRLWKLTFVGQFFSLLIVAMIWLSFVYFLPIWVGIPTASEMVERFFWIRSWR